MGFVEHPRLRPGTLEDRAYQAAIAEAALKRPTLVVLPTGLGKTAVALRVAAECRLREPTRSILFLAPTRPLVAQHARSLREALLAPDPVEWTGHVAPSRRAAGGEPPAVLVATPQVVAHDVAKGTLDLARFSLVVFDEAHRAVGDYPYVTIGAAARALPSIRVLAMTASPGASLPRIRAVWSNLGLSHFEYRTADDADVRPYVFGTEVETLPVSLPPVLQAFAIRLRTTVRGQAEILHRAGRLPAGEMSRRALLDVGTRIHGEIAAARAAGGSPDPRIWAANSAQAVAMKAVHALELAESQGIGALRGFLDRQGRPGPSGRISPTSKAFLADPSVAEVVREIAELDLEHPKVEAAVGLVVDTIRRSPEAKVLLFTQYRATADVLLEALRARGGEMIRAARFVGQASRGNDEGLTQKAQVALLDEFRAGRLNTLVATSVAEEGLDIPSTDLVVFYEPVPDLVRTIQRRGRTGRSAIGRVVVLVAEGTRDVGVNRGARRREHRMHELLEQLEAEAARGEVRAPPPGTKQRSLTDFGPPA